MAVAKAGQVSNQGTAASSIAVTSVIPSGSDRFLVCSGGNSSDPARTLSSITFGATAVAGTGYDILHATFFRSWCNVLINPAAESRTVTATFSDTADEIVVGAIWFTGVHQTTATSGHVEDSGSGNFDCDLAVTSESGDMGFAGCYNWWQNSLTEDGDGTAAWTELNIGTATDAAGLTAAGAATINFSVTGSGSQSAWGIGGFNIEAAAAGATTQQALNASAIGTATISRQTGKAVSVTSFGTATLARTVGKNVSASATGTATLTTAATFLQALDAIATGTATLARAVGKAISATATGTATLAKKTSKTLAASAVGTATISAGILFSQTLVGVATGTATLATQFIAFVAVVGRSTNNLLRHMMHWHDRG